MDTGKMILKGYMISGLKLNRVSSGWEILVRLRCGGSILFEYRNRHAADNMWGILKETWGGARSLEVCPDRSP